MATLEERLLEAAPVRQDSLSCRKHPSTPRWQEFYLEGRRRCWLCLVEEVEQIKRAAYGEGYTHGVDGKGWAAWTKEHPA